MERSLPSRILKLVVAIAVCEAAGVLGSLFTIPKIPTWYQTLTLPSFAPPSWVFGPVWVTLYLLMGVALFRIWEERPHAPISGAVLVFAVQLVVNVLWSYLFFGLESPLYGLVAIIILWALILLTIREFYRISRPAAYLLIPYIIWVSLAGVLNFAIWTLN